MQNNSILQVQQSLWDPLDLMIIDEEVIPAAQAALPAISAATTHVRRAIYAPNTIFSRLTGTGAGSREEKWDMDGVLVKAQLGRLHAFKNNQSCSCCGITGTFFLLERHVNEADGGGYSLVLYATDHNDELVALTADHILPDSLGGRFATSNFQTMCRPCNQNKAHLITQAEIDRIRSNMHLHAKDWVNLELLGELLNLRERCLVAPEDEVEELHKLFESTRKLLVHGTAARKQREAIIRIQERLAPPPPPPLKWYQRWINNVKQYCKDVPIPYVG